MPIHRVILNRSVEQFLIAGLLKRRSMRGIRIERWSAEHPSGRPGKYMSNGRL
ncbi:predicted protein [Botrytis cinerea T4]|uniref:Uncharacterized protein n=1 Tax=Botryotinia fuckeliana (strain T4) TaxID=999810 RepID=G2XQN7_BOTF4|nr:predicted protein [Botrytis cinerea T4]